jgi:WD40 repeat protein
MDLNKVQRSEKAISMQALYEIELAKSRRALDQKDYLSAAFHAREARSQPGYRYEKEIGSIWTKLYRFLPKKGFNGIWKAMTLSSGNTRYISVCFSRNGQYALSSGDNQIDIWDIEKGSSIISIGHNGLRSASISPDGQSIVSGGFHGEIKIWDIRTGKVLKEFNEHTREVKSVCFSSDGEFVLSGSPAEIKLWSVNRLCCLRTYDQMGSEERPICFSVDGHLILFERFGVIECWNWVENCCVRSLKSPFEINSLSLSYDGRYLLSGSLCSGVIQMWDLLTGSCLRTLQGHFDLLTSVCLSWDGKYALSGSRDSTLKLWDITTGECLQIFQIHTDTVKAACFSPDMSYILSGASDKDGTLKLLVLDWKLEI